MFASTVLVVVCKAMCLASYTFRQRGELDVCQYSVDSIESHVSDRLAIV